MHGSSWGIRIDSSDISRDKLTLQHSIVHNSASHLISASHARINGYNCQLTNAGGALLHLTACRSEWIHCTVANLYNWDVISTPALTLLEYSPADSVAPEMQPRFLIANSIVTTRGLFMAPSEIEGLNISFDNCLFQVNGEDDENFLSCIWEKDPAFVATTTFSISGLPNLPLPGKPEAQPISMTPPPWTSTAYPVLPTAPVPTSEPAIIPSPHKMMRFKMSCFSR